MLKQIYNTVRNLIKIGQLVSVNDTGDIQLAVNKTFGVEKPAFVIAPYGLCSNAPAGSMAVELNPQGLDSNTAVLLMAPDTRLKNLKSGEVALLNHLTSANIKFTEDGGCTISITGPMSISGSDVTISGGSVTLDTGVVVDNHVHQYFDDGAPADTDVPKN